MKTYAEAIDAFIHHAEAKSLDSQGIWSNAQGAGLLARTPIRALSALHIGKETNLLEEQEQGIAHSAVIPDPQAVYTSGGEWEALRPLVKRVPLRRLAEETGIPKRRLRAYRGGERVPPRQAFEAIVVVLGRVLVGPAQAI